MSNYKVGDRVRVKADSPTQTTRRGEVFTITSLDRSAISKRPYAGGDKRGTGIWLDNLEHVPEQVDRTPYPKYGDWGSRIHIGRNAGLASQWYGDPREHEHGIYIKVEGGGISTAEAREIAKYLNDLADRIEHDQAIVAAGNDAKREAERKKIRQQIAELEKKLED